MTAFSQWTNLSLYRGHTFFSATKTVSDSRISLNSALFFHIPKTNCNQLHFLVNKNNVLNKRLMGHIAYLNNNSCNSFEIYKCKTFLKYCKTHKNSHRLQGLTIHKQTQWAFLIKVCLLSVISVFAFVNFSHFHLILQNHFH